MPRHVIGITGEIKAGKGLVSARIASRWDCDYTRFSIPLAKILDVLHAPKTRENLQDLFAKLRELLGEDVLADVIDKDCEAATKYAMIVDGVRRQADIKMLARRPNFRLIYITAPIEMRYAWMVAQAEKEGEAATSFEQFKMRNEVVAEQEIPIVGATAHLRIDNVGSVEDVHRQLDAFLSELDSVAHG